MKILAIETSCDETAAAIISKAPQENYVKALSNIVASSLNLHSKTGGIVPEIAAREQVKYIIPVIKKAIESSKLSRRSGIPQLAGKIEEIDAIAVTVGPGLIGSLLVGVETAKTLAYLWKKPIIPVNHLLGHIYANFINSQLQTHNLQLITFPAIALIVSGGHTDLVLMKGHKKIKWIGGTLDDAAGEAFDKIGRLLNLPYPGGPAIEKASENGDKNSFNFPSPMIYSKDFNFSFSGLKTAVLREVLSSKYKVLSMNTKRDIAAAVQKSIISVLVKKTVRAAKMYKVKSILLGGGVASNKKLQEELILNTKYLIPNTAIFVPQKSLCTDNAAMIGAYAAFNYKPIQWTNIAAKPQLYF